MPNAEAVGPPRGPVVRRSQRRGDTRRRIADHATASFAEFGYEVTTNRIIADRAGLTPAAVHHHFPAKRDLMFAIHESVAEQYLSRLAHAGGVHDSRAARIDRLLMALHNIIVSNRLAVVFGLVAREEARRFEELKGLTSDSDARFVELFNDVAGGVAGDQRTGWPDENILGAALSVVALGLAAVSLDTDAAAHRSLTEKFCQLFTASLTVTAAAQKEDSQ